MKNDLYDNFKKYNVPGKKDPVWYNTKLGQEVNSEIKAALDKLEQEIDPSKRMEAIDFMKLPKVGEKGEKVTAGSELPRMTLNLTGRPSSKNESIELTGTLSSSETTTVTGGATATAATPVRPSSKGPEELLNDAFTLLKDRPEDPEAQAKAEVQALGELLGELLKDSAQKLNSIDKGIQELVLYFKSEEKEEDAAEIEIRRAKERQDAERLKELKEKSIEELTQRAEALESQNKEKEKNKRKSKDGFFKLLHHNLAEDMPFLFKDPYKMEEEKEEEDEDKKGSGVMPIVAGGAKFLGGAALATGGAALAAGTGLSLGYLSDVTGASSTLSQTFLGTSKEEADKAAAQRAEAATSFVDELLGIERVSKKDGSLDWKKTWGFENPFEVAEDYLFRGEGPLAPTGSKYKERTTEMLRPTPVPKADLADPTKNLAKISDDVSKASKKQMQSATVINNNTVNNITNQNATSLTSINSRGRGALELAT